MKPLAINETTTHKGVERGNTFRCDICGKFIGYTEFERDEIRTDYKPETVYECERITHVHKHCLNPDGKSVHFEVKEGK
jgi:hypothetical protein